MKTLIKNIYKSLFQNRITKYEEEETKDLEVSAKDARVLSEAEYNFKLSQVTKDPKKYQNKVFRKILEETKYKGNQIHYPEDKHEAILIMNNINGFYDKLIELGYTIKEPHEYTTYLYINW